MQSFCSGQIVGNDEIEVGIVGIDIAAEHGIEGQRWIVQSSAQSSDEAEELVGGTEVAKQMGLELGTISVGGTAGAVDRIDQPCVD